MASHNRTHASDRGKVIPDLPQTPTIGTATGYIENAFITFTAPVLGGLPTSYTALSNPGSITGTGTSSPIKVSGLTAGTAYTFTVRGNNATGSSEYSSASNSVTPIAGPPTGYSLWLDAADTTTITSSSGAVSVWTDKSTNAYTFSQATSTNQPTTGTRTINGRNVIDFDGTNDRLVLSQAKTAFKFMNNSATTWFIVAQPDATSDYGLYFATEAGSGSRTGANLWHYTSKLNAAVHSGTPGVVNIWNYEAVTTTSISTAAFYATIKSDPNNATAANRGKLRINNGSYEGSNTYTSATNSNDPENAMTIGAWYDNYNNANSYGSHLNGVIGEILIYPSALSDGNIESVRSYLATKWGI
jgi:hypothetical protein